MEKKREAVEQLPNNRAWQKILGCSGADFFPVLRMPDATCSNSFLLRTPQYLILVDPGADARHTDTIIEILKAQLHDTPRPVLIFLTHCHRDHAWQCGRVVSSLAGTPVFVLAHPEGVRALRQRDEGITLGYLFKEEVPVIRPLIPLLLNDDKAEAPTRGIPLDEDGTLNLRCEKITLENGKGSTGLAIFLGDKACLHVYPAPGHSPDSILIGVGKILLLGDLPFAANPGVAGVVGWDQCGLVQSLAATAGIIRDQGVELCFPGHGLPMPAAKALKVLESARARAADLVDVAHLDADRVHYLKDHAEVVLAEAAELFTRIGGKLFSLSLRMEQLEEPEEAQRILDALDVASIDSCLTDFQKFAETFDYSSLEIALPLKGFRVIGRIESALAGSHLEGLIAPSLLRRARRLLTDFINTMQGLPAKDFSRPEDVNLVLMEALASLHDTAEANEQLLNSLDDPHSFARALTERIARRSVLERSALRLDAQIGLPPVLVDKACLADAIISVLERLAVKGAEQITLQTRLDPPTRRIKLRITATDLTDLRSCFSEHQKRFLHSTLKPFGAQLDFERETQPEAVVIKLPIPDDNQH